MTGQNWVPCYSCYCYCYCYWHGTAVKSPMLNVISDNVIKADSGGIWSLSIVANWKNFSILRSTNYWNFKNALLNGVSDAIVVSVGDHGIGNNWLTDGIGLPCIRHVRWASLFSPEWTRSVSSSISGGSGGVRFRCCKSPKNCSKEKVLKKVL